MARQEHPPTGFPALRPPRVLFPPSEDAAEHRSPPAEPLLGRLRSREGDGVSPLEERFTVVLESLLPDPDRALGRLLDQQREEGAALDAHWRLSAKEIGSGAREVWFEPTVPNAADPALLASGSFGRARIEISIMLAHATPGEEEGLHAAMAAGKRFKVIVLSHEVDPG